MKIAVIGPQNTGKSTFVKDFLLEFPAYKTTQKTYRDIVTENNLK
jgi:signal recognition particle receptor subunit beta